MARVNGKLPDSIYSRLFAKLYNPVMDRVEARLLMKMRRSLLSHAYGQVLEVGAGTGVNFPLYNKASKVLAIEPSKAMAAKAYAVLESNGFTSIRLLEAGLGDAAVEAELGENQLDVIVCTLVLCTLPDLAHALESFQRWLKPGGRLLVLEHVHDRRQPQRWLQSFFTPVWKHLAEGCRLNRPTDEILKDFGFLSLNEDYHLTRWMPFYTAVFSWQGQENE
ncbi:MAG: class I SAM-dependent methyltransferase [Mameliella sp.]|nr:class I SAM-dependent methyltransferase [Phaeodactylibacter sp.]NRA47894.1 class I SAM-dependent methyltransferase [Phaeodactylibacter sp.]